MAEGKTSETRPTRSQAPNPGAGAGGQRHRIEDIVLISVIALGLLLPAACFLMGADHVPGVFSAFLLGLAGAALVYRFLGGIDDAAFQTKTIKLGGSIAALVILTLFLSHKIEAQSKGYSGCAKELADAARRLKEAEADPKAIIIGFKEGKRAIGENEIKLVNVLDLPRENLNRTFRKIIGDVLKEQDVPVEEQRELLQSFCRQIGVAFSLSNEQKRGLQELPALFGRQGKGTEIDTRWWKEIIYPLLQERCDDCTEESCECPDELDALDDFPFAIYWVQSQGKSEFKIVVAGGGKVVVGEDTFAVPVLANPKRRKTAKLADPDGDYSPVDEAMVLVPQ